MSRQKGFTLIELLVVIGIIAILAAIVIIAVNPGRQFAQSRNAQRNSDAQAILNAVHQNATDNDGNLPNDNGGSAIATCPATTTATNMSSALVPTYLSIMPTDPSTGSSDNYVICQTGGRIKVAANQAELGETIEFER